MFTDEEIRLLLWSVSCGMFDEGEFSGGNSERYSRLVQLQNKLKQITEQATASV